MMSGLAGIAFDLFARMVDKGVEAYEEAEEAKCQRNLERYKTAFKQLQADVIEYKKYYAEIISDLNHTIMQLQAQARNLTDNNNDLIARLTKAYIKETTGGVATLEEYDAAMKEDQEGE